MLSSATLRKILRSETGLTIARIIYSAAVQARQTGPASAFPRARARLTVSQLNCAFPGVGAVFPNRIQTSGFRQAGPVVTKRQASQMTEKKDRFRLPARRNFLRRVKMEKDWLQGMPAQLADAYLNGNIGEVDFLSDGSLPYQEGDADTAEAAEAE